MPDINESLAFVTRELSRYIFEEKVEPLITDDLVEEHRQNPFGSHSPNLEVVLTYLRRHYHTQPRYVIITTKPEEEYCVALHPRLRGEALELVGECLSSEEEIQHAIFLKRISDVTAMWENAPTWGSRE